MTSPFDTYLRRLRETPLDQHTEHTGRAALEDLLRAFAPRAAVVQHEPKRERSRGAPDFKIKQRGSILGYVEVKGIGSPLDSVLKSDQIARYRQLSGNIVLTDYLQWLWLDTSGVRDRATLAYPTDLEGRTIRLRAEAVAAVSNLIKGFFSEAPQGVGRAQELALALATRCSLLRDALTLELTRQEQEHRGGRLFGLLDVFRRQVFLELSTREFADAFAQMLAYGLFLARLNAPADQAVTLHNVDRFVPGSFRLIRELVEFLKQLEAPEYDDARWIVDEVLSIVNGLDLPAIHEDLSFRQRKAISRRVRARDEEEHRLFERDPFIYFYEDFLKAYDPAMRKGRGVYYTPPPVVNFIVRAIDDILKDRFGIPRGLADHRRVTVLDFACGTGTFLLEVIRRIFENIGGPDAGAADLVVREHVTKNLYGFEYLIAPYTIAHLKLSQFLAEQGRPLRDGERLQVFLTNTLEPVEPQRNLLLPAISDEVEAAQDVKNKPILVILGNPPYSGHSKNKGAWISRAIDGYKFTVETDGAGREAKKPLGERNSKWLNDDYVKFIRFAQLKMDAIDEGIVGVITNHSWFDNPTFRGMRQSLLRSFHQIHVIDLHGSMKRRERAPDGSDDENVFDIQQGVAISLLVKKTGLERGVWRGDLWGRRLEKYRALAEATLGGFAFSPLAPTKSFYLFAHQEEATRQTYESGWRLPDIFPVNVLGFQTHRDAFAIAFTEAEIRSRLTVFSDPHIADEDVAQRFGLRSNRDWSLPDSRAAARAGLATPPIEIAYRPFDDRWAEYSSVTMDYPRRELLDHVVGRANICLLTSRQVNTETWGHVFSSVRPAESCVISSYTKSQNFVFPLRIYDKSAHNQENISAPYRIQLDSFIENHASADEIFGYIYAILYAPTYRARFADYLRIDFPRIPFPKASAEFESLAVLGWALVQAHLLRQFPRRGLAQYHGTGDHRVETPRYAAAEQAVWINSGQRFSPVPADVWAHQIGGYQVLDKYLRSRKGRALSLDEVTHIGAVADVMAFTIEQMARIDQAYRAAFPEHV